ncbi:MAG: hypothetical protein ACP5JJ_00550 [Anaerolineae bacterium]
MRQKSARLGLVAVMALCALWMVAAVQAQATGVLEGQLGNGTLGGPQIGAGVPVILHAFQGDSEVSTLEAATDAQGTFRFEGLDTDPALEYWPEAVYLDVAYTAEGPYQFEPGETQLSVTLTVYEVTSDDVDVKVDSVHIIAESFGQVLRISEIHLVGNVGDRTYVGTLGDAGQRETLFVPLPEDAVGLSFGEDVPADRFFEARGGLRDTEPVFPGRETSLIFFSYHLMVAGDAVPFGRSFAYPLDILNMLVARPGLTLRSAQIASQGVELFQGQEYELFSLVALPADTAVSMELVPAEGQQSMPEVTGEGAGSAVGGSTLGNQGLLQAIGFGLAGLAVVAVVVYPFATRQSSRTQRQAQDLVVNPRARELLSELVLLEESYDAGRIDQASYRQRRSQIYGALKAI